jgi:hypothetical protein
LIWSAVLFYEAEHHAASLAKAELSFVMADDTSFAIRYMTAQT